MALTDKQISALDACIDEFGAADYESWEEMVQGFLGSFKRACPQGIKFDAITMKTICASLATLGCSQIFLAYSPAPLWQCQTGNEEICSEKSKSDG